MSTARPLPPPPFSAAAEVVKERLHEAARELHEPGMPEFELQGQLIRPTIALAFAAGVGAYDDTPRFWRAALAIQLAHEASVVHDDIVDGASERRNRPTRAAARGVGAALVHGDHLLTMAYRAAAATGSLDFVRLFARAVERTVAGERLQGKLRGSVLDRDSYRAVVAGKSGALIGCAAATAAVLRSDPRAEALEALGVEIGVLYQMLDDLLDYVPAAHTGKRPFADHAGRIWTWPLLHLPGHRFDWSEEAVDAAMRRADPPSPSPVELCAADFESKVDAVLAQIHDLLPEEGLIKGLLTGWVSRTRPGTHAPGPPTQPDAGPSEPLRARVPALEESDHFLALHSRSFRAAAAWFPRPVRARVARVYLFCRVTDDLVDRPAGQGSADRNALLAEWERLGHAAYLGRTSGIASLDAVMTEMAAFGIPFRYAAELIEGMRMDLRGERYRTMEELGRYTHRVASVVGLWLSELFGVRDPAVLRRAEALGHAMQITNILRDVGEDWRQDRLYLPSDLMERHGVTPEDIAAGCAGAAMPAGYRTLLDEMMGAADAAYLYAEGGIGSLPTSVRLPVAAAAQIYRGIHREIVRAGYDNLTRRAFTTRGRKVTLVGRAIWTLIRPVPRAAPEAAIAGLFALQRGATR